MNSERNIIMKLKESAPVNEGRAVGHNLFGMNKNGRKVMIQGTVKRAVPGTEVWVDNHPHYKYKGNNVWVYGPEKHEYRSDEVAFDLGFLALNGRTLYVEK